MVKTRPHVATRWLARRDRLLHLQASASASIRMPLDADVEPAHRGSQALGEGAQVGLIDHEHNDEFVPYFCHSPKCCRKPSLGAHLALCGDCHAFRPCHRWWGYTAG